MPLTDLQSLTRDELEAEVRRLRAEAGSATTAPTYLEAVFDSAIDFAIVVTDTAGVVTRWNSGAENILGWTAGEMLGGDAAQFFTPEDRAAGRVELEMSLALATGSALDERWHLRKDGERFWASGKMMPVTDAGGAPIGFVKIMRDLTQEHLRGEVLRAGEARRDALVELSGELAECNSNAGRLVDAAMRVLGRTLDAQLAGYGLIDAHAETITIEHGWTNGEVQSLSGTMRFRDFGSYIDDLKRGDIVIIGDTHEDKRTAETAEALDAISVRALVNIPIVEQGRIVAVLYVCSSQPRSWSGEELQFIGEVAIRTRTATARLIAEDEVRAGEAELRLIANSLPFLVSFIDRDLNYRFVNAAYRDWLDLTPEELIGRNIASVTGEEGFAERRPAIERVLAGEQVRMDVSWPWPDGRRRIADIRYTPRRDARGRVDGFYAFVQDVTEIREAAALLEARVAERSLELMRTEEALRQSQKVEAIGQLTGGVAHDFNNLLTVIRGSVDLLRRPGLSDDRRLRYIDAIADTADRATKLTNQLLAFARRQTLKPEVFDAVESVRAVADMVRTLTGARVRVSLRVPSDACFIDADRSQFDTAIVNMAVNARDAMNGEGELTITVAEVSGMPAIRAHPAMTGEFVTVSLTDSGTGIPPESLEKIFEPFFTTKGLGEGTGLGLSQVFGFTKQSGGDVFVGNEEGGGATFTMYLPRVEGVSGAAAEAVNNSLPLGRGACVLVVEDNAEVGMFATEALEELGFNTVWAVDGHKALAELASGAQQFDVVFSDVMMPGMSGIELRREINRLYPSMPVLLTSGYSEILAQSGTSGLDLLHKPYSIDALTRALSKVLSFQRAGERRSCPPSAPMAQI